MDELKLHREVEDFLYMEAELLDAWKLEDWLALFAPDARYLVPSGDLSEGVSSDANLFYIADDAVLLRERVKRLYKRNAHAEWPHSKTCHLIGNVRLVDPAVEGELSVRCVFITHRNRSGVTDVFAGSIRYRLTRIDGALRIREKICYLNYDSLREQGRISILL